MRDDFGLESEGVLSDLARGAHPAALAVRRADLLVTVKAHADWVIALGKDLQKEVIVIADLFFFLYLFLLLFLFRTRSVLFCSVLLHSL